MTCRSLEHTGTGVYHVGIVFMVKRRGEKTQISVVDEMFTL